MSSDERIYELWKPSVDTGGGWSVNPIGDVYFESKEEAIKEAKRLAGAYGSIPLKAVFIKVNGKFYWLQSAQPVDVKIHSNDQSMP